MKLKEMFLTAVHYVVSRLTEPSSYKGLMIVVGAGGWNRLDSTSKGEVIMQICLVAFGLVMILLPQKTQYGGQ